MISFRRLIWLVLLAPAVWAQMPSPSPTPTPRQIFTVSGIVVNAVTGEPLPRTEVAISSIETHDILQSVTSGEDGSFIFPAVRTGKYLLVGARKGFRQQLYEEHEGLSTAISVGIGLESESLVFRLKPDASISGIITDEQNEPIENAQVLLLHETAINGVPCTEVEQGVLSDEDGYYHFGHLASGKYFLTFIARPWYAPEPSASDVMPDSQEIASRKPFLEQFSAFDVAYPRSFYADTTDASRATAVLLKPGERRQANMILTAVPSVHIRVKTPNDPSATVQITVAQTLVNGVERLVPALVERVDRDFMEVSGVAPGRYALRILLASSKNTVEVDKAVNALADTEIDAVAGNSATLITGVLKFSDAQPGLPDLSQMYVQLHKRETGEVLTSRVGDAGQFMFAPAPPISGRYELVVGTGSDSLPVTITATGAVARGHILEIKHDWPVGLTVVLASPVGRIDGVALRKKTPVSGAMILLVPQDPEHNISLFRRGQSNSDGTFTLQNVTTGWYTIVAIENGWDLEWTNPSAIKGYLAGGTDVSVWYNPNPKVAVQVQDLARPKPTATAANSPLPTQE